MKKYNHAYTLAFSLNSNDKEGDDVTSEDLIKALLARIEGLKKEGEIICAIGCPFDTYENQQ